MFALLACLLLASADPACAAEGEALRHLRTASGAGPELDFSGLRDRWTATPGQPAFGPDSLVILTRDKTFGLAPKPQGMLYAGTPLLVLRWLPIAKVYSVLVPCPVNAWELVFIPPEDLRNPASEEEFRQDRILCAEPDSFVSYREEGRAPKLICNYSLPDHPQPAVTDRRSFLRSWDSREPMAVLRGLALKDCLAAGYLDCRVRSHFVRRRDDGTARQSVEVVGDRYGAQKPPANQEAAGARCERLWDCRDRFASLSEASPEDREAVLSLLEAFSCQAASDRAF